MEAPGIFIMFSDILADLIDNIPTEDVQPADVVIEGRRWDHRQKRYADDECFASGTHGGLRNIATVADAFYLLTGMETNAIKTILVETTETGERIGRTRANGTIEDFTTVTAGSHFKYLGIRTTATGSSEPTRIYIQEILDEVERKLLKKRCKLDAIWTALRSVVYPQITYSARFLPFRDEILASWDAQIARMLRRAAGKPRTLPAAMVFSPQAYNGTGIFRLSDAIRREAVILMVNGLNNPESDKGSTLYRYSARGKKDSWATQTLE
jgi:hypothetical protein